MRSHRWPRALLPLLVVAILTVSIGGPMPGVAVANTAQCGPGPDNRFAGYQDYWTLPTSWYDTPTGVSSYIQVSATLLCSSITNYASNFSANFVALYNTMNVFGYPGEMGGLSQAGWMTTGVNPGSGGNYCNFHFGAWTRSGQALSLPSSSTTWYWTVRRDLGCLANQSIYYEVSRDASTNILQDWVWYGNQWRFLGQPALNIYTWQRWTPAYLAESAYKGSDVAGNFGQVNHFDGLQIQAADTLQFHATPCYLAATQVTLPRYHWWATDCTHTYTWTDPLNSW